MYLIKTKYDAHPYIHNGEIGFIPAGTCSTSTMKAGENGDSKGNGSIHIKTVVNNNSLL